MVFANDWMNARESTGTTIMATEFADGVIVGADSRTSTGTYVANRVTDKLTRVSDLIYCCRSGSAADTQAIADAVSYSLSYNEVQTGRPPLVREAASEFQKFCYEYRDSMVAGIIVAGYDEKLGGQVYSVPLGGMMVRQEHTIGGSGSGFIYGLVKELYKPKMQKQECIDFVKKCIFQAMAHDGSSGGVCRVAVITKDGVERHIFFAKDGGRGGEAAGASTDESRME